MARASARATPRARAGSMWLQGLACGALLAFAPALALLLTVLLAPALIGLLLDRERGHPVARAVLLAGAGFVLAPAWHLFQGGNNLATAMDLLAEPVVLAPAWIAGAVGWALCEVLPVILRVIAEIDAAARIADLKAEEKALRAAWDLDSEA